MRACRCRYAASVLVQEVRHRAAVGFWPQRKGPRDRYGQFAVRPDRVAQACACAAAAMLRSYWARWCRRRA